MVVIVLAPIGSNCEPGIPKSALLALQGKTPTFSSRPLPPSPRLKAIIIIIPNHGQ